jgi:hypothetical protein
MVGIVAAEKQEYEDGIERVESVGCRHQTMALHNSTSVQMIMEELPHSNLVTMVLIRIEGMKATGFEQYPYKYTRAHRTTDISVVCIKCSKLGFLYKI